MKFQEIVSDVRSRVETAGKHYQGAFQAYVDAQRKALGVVTRNGHTLANTEIGAAKNIFSAARASFDKARTDGVRRVANNPQAYVPNGRNQIVSAYKDTINLLVRTGNELTDVVSYGYKTVRAKLAGRSQPANKATSSRKSAGAKTASASAAKKTTAKKTSATKTTAKRKTASTRTASAKGTAKTKSTGAGKTASRKTTASATTSSNGAS